MNQFGGITIRPWHEVAGWDAFVEAHPQGSIFHHSSMIRAQAAAKRHRPWAFAAINASDQVCALLVAVKVSTLPEWAGAVAARSIFYAEPIYLDGDEGRHAVELLIEKHDQTMRRLTLFAEVRPYFAPPSEVDPLQLQGYPWLGYYNYELDLRQTEATLFAGLDSKCRNHIRSSHKRGVTVEEVEPHRKLDQFYSVVAQSYRHSKVPLVDRSFFEAVFQELPRSRCRMYFARYQEEVAAVSCFLAFKERVIYWYAGARRITGIAAMEALLWEAVRRYSAEGYAVFDFAGAGWEGENYGPGKFKAKFGGTLTNFGRYRRVYSPWKLRLATSAYQSARHWIAPKVKDA